MDKLEKLKEEIKKRIIVPIFWKHGKTFAKTSLSGICLQYSSKAGYKYVYSTMKIKISFIARLLLLFLQNQVKFHVLEKLWSVKIAVISMQSLL